ncbi:MAG: hypothetical protein ACOCYO_03900 [Bacteroidota bacterium]
MDETVVIPFRKDIFARRAAQRKEVIEMNCHEMNTPDILNF